MRSRSDLGPREVACIMVFRQNAGKKEKKEEEEEKKEKICMDSI
jgi:hypothetical protein